MSAAPLPKVLKVGVVLGEQLVEERVVAAAGNVSIGSDKGNTFQIEGDSLLGGQFVVFLWKDGVYHIRFKPGVKGKVTSLGERKSLEKAVKEAGIARDGEAFLLPLNEEDKGKIEAGAVTLLFRFVEAPPPPVAAPPQRVADFRPKLLDDDDRVFFGWLAVWSSLAVVFGVWVTNAERPVVSYEDLPERFTRSEMPREKPEAEVETEAESETKAEEKKPEEKKPEDKPPPKDQKEVAKAVEEAKKSLVDSSALFRAMQAQMVGTTGDQGKGTLLIDGSQGIADLSGKINEVSGQLEAGSTSGIRGGLGVPGGTGDKSIGGVSGGVDGGTGTQLSSAPVIKVKASVSADALDFDGGDAVGVKKVILNYKGQLLVCHEQSLKLNPKVAGKLTIGWTVAGGVASDVHVIDNTTDDKDLEACVVGKIRRWKFTDVPDGDVKNTFVFQPKSE